MFNKNKNFYPTPSDLVTKMLQGLELEHIKYVLEPSAGKGDILNGLKEKEKEMIGVWYKHEFNIDCIEIDNELQDNLKGKGYNVIFNDFLKFETLKEYDLIVMNPPFSEGDKHLLKAIKMQEKNGGYIVALLNAETLKNPFSNIRKELLIKLEEYNAHIEYIKNAFSDAERRTDVEIAMIKITIPRKQRASSLIVEELEKAKKYAEIEQEENYSLISNDFIKEIIHQYKLESEVGVKFIKEYYAMQPYILSEFTDHCTKYNSILKLKLDDKEDVTVNGFLKKIRLKYWKALFSNEKFVNILTKNLQNEYRNKIYELEDYDFNLHNIYQLKMDMNKNILKGIEETIVQLFDDLGHRYAYYSNGKNVHYYNGWKTNKSYIVNKKVIIPLYAFDWFERYEPTKYNVVERLQDIEKCFDYLNNREERVENVDLLEQLKIAQEKNNMKNIKLKYFNITFYKKGTCHITFTNLEILKKFNIYGSQKKGWLPPAYGKVNFSDMTNEEKEIIQKFEGENSYHETIKEQDFYIVTDNNILLLNQTA